MTRNIISVIIQIICVGLDRIVNGTVIFLNLFIGYGHDIATRPFRLVCGGLYAANRLTLPFVKVTTSRSSRGLCFVFYLLNLLYQEALTHFPPPVRRPSPSRVQSG